MAVDDEGNQACVRRLPKSPGQTKRRAPVSVEFHRDDRRGLLEDAANVEVLRGHGRHTKSRTGDTRRVRVPSAIGLHEQYERLISLRQPTGWRGRVP